MGISLRHSHPTWKKLDKMKFQLTFKTPAVLDYMLENYQDTHCSEHEEHNEWCGSCLGLEDKACKALEAIQNCTNQFVKYGELITVEFDTDAGTATVVKV